MSFEPVIKWSGSKRSQSRKIVEYFPDNINTYYEPFIGGGSVLYALMTSDKKVKNFICSDINSDLINLWNYIKSNPNEIHEGYLKMWLDLNQDDNKERRNAYYMSVRDRFNKERNPIDFVFINRTCTNGLIRYNKKGEFNTSFHFSRKGINPDNLHRILNQWSEFLNKNNVQFIHQDYLEVSSNENDVIYADPPYAATKGMYFGIIDYEEFFNWIRGQKGKVLFSFDGKRGNSDYTYEVPNDLYEQHIYLTSGVSSFSRLKIKENTKVFESLYIC